MYEVLVKTGAALVVSFIYLVGKNIYDVINSYFQKRNLCLSCIKIFIEENIVLFNKLIYLLPYEFIDKSKKKLTRKNINKYIKTGEDKDIEIMALLVISSVAIDELKELLNSPIYMPDINVYREIFIASIKKLQEKGFYQPQQAETIIENIKNELWLPPSFF